MIPLFTLDEWNNSKCNDLLRLQCSYCHAIYTKTKTNINTKALMSIKSGRSSSKIDYLLNSPKFCSTKCYGLSRYSKIQFKCTQCQKEFIRRIKKDKQAKTNNRFCSLSCSATYNNLHKKHGTRVSKLELWLATQLPILYPNIEFHFNRKDAINSELDIYIPSLKLAFELNGIFHYEPIYGLKTFNQIQNNDKRKFQACLENNIELCIIDTSTQKYFKEHTSQKFLDIISTVINQKLVAQPELESGISL